MTENKIEGMMWRLVTYYIPLIVGGLIAITWKKVKHNYE